MSQALEERSNNAVAARSAATLIKGDDPRSRATQHGAEQQHRRWMSAAMLTKNGHCLVRSTAIPQGASTKTVAMISLIGAYKHSNSSFRSVAMALLGARQLLFLRSVATIYHNGGQKLFVHKEYSNDDEHWG